MAYVRAIKLPPHISFTADIPDLILIDNHTYVLDPSTDEEKRKLWYSHVLIPYSISSITCTFMGFLPRSIRKSWILKYFFPSHPLYEPVTIYTQTFLFVLYEETRVSTISSTDNNASYMRWLDRV